MTLQVGDANSNPVFTDVVQQAQSLAALNANNRVTLRGQSSASIQVTAIGVQTLVFEVSTDGSNFTAVVAYPVVGGAPITSTTVTGHWECEVAGFNIFQVRCSAFTSGTATVSVVASQGTTATIATSAAGLPTFDLVRWSGTALGVPTNFGTTPTAVVAASVNSSLFIGTTAAVAASAGVQKIGVTGNTGANLDAAGVNANAVPANSIMFAGGSVAGATNIVPTTVKAASTAAAATDTSLVVQPLVGSAVMATVASGVQKVGVVGSANVAFDSATGAAVPVNAILLGGRAQNANPTAVTNGQMVAFATDLAGRVINTPLNYRALFGWTGTTVSVNTISTIAAAAGASVFRDICTIVITTAGLVAQTITITDGTNTWIIDYPNAAVAPVPFVINFGDTPLKATTANTVWQTTQSLATTCHYLVSFVDRLA